MSTTFERLPVSRSQLGRIARKFRDSKQGLLGLALMAVLFVTALVAPFVIPYDPATPDVAHRLEGPSSAHLFGTDEIGRDIFSRVLLGTRISLYVGFTSVAIALVFGATIGVVAGYYKSYVDEGLMRTMDALMSFPPILLAITIVAMLEPNLNNVILAIGLIYTPYIARVTRSAALSVSTEPYVKAAVARGEGDLYIIFREVLPNCMGPVIVQASINIGFAILAEAGLSFLGMGAQPPTPSWGLMINVARGYYTQAPWMVVYPGLAIATAVFAFNLLGDGLRDVLDPEVGIIE